LSWIKTIPYEEAEGPLKKLYDRIKGPDNNVDNVMLIHSLRPHSMTGHMQLYKNVLHNSNNTLPKWYLEALGVYVSYLNHCDYCLQHHFAGFKRLINNDSRAEAFYKTLPTENIVDFFEEKRYRIGMRHAKKLTLNHKDITQDDISTLRNTGFSDGEILEINQVVSYFNYVNRTVVGLGVTTEGDIIGLSPGNSDDPDDWGHR